MECQLAPLRSSGPVRATLVSFGWMVGRSAIAQRGDYSLDEPEPWALVKLQKPPISANLRPDSPSN
ncbi:hypothetical protein SBA5_670022 [Candidatus Sulfotelmatomonas gaucii]|uniref:Uncharacterized protein n=1 Tax=Candidatus Sulfuritelmatomonas gaucii TaxID=2043161 RepID=A0A2N9LZG9_9BACT|nr:hypothetical protein SBA5_670022 [Candidatus Sulfotelmatomonas gaucii]